MLAVLTFLGHSVNVNADSITDVDDEQVFTNVDILMINIQHALPADMSVLTNTLTLAATLCAVEPNITK